MKIKSFKISKDDPIAKGLTPGSFEIRSNIVALVGRNGSGKSRMLDYIFSSITDFNFEAKLAFSGLNEQLSKLLLESVEYHRRSKNFQTSTAGKQRKTQISNYLMSNVKLI